MSRRSPNVLLLMFVGGGIFLWNLVEVSASWLAWRVRRFDPWLILWGLAVLLTPFLWAGIATVYLLAWSFKRATR